MFDMLNVRERAMLEEMKRRDPNAPRDIARLEAARQWRGEFFQNQNPVFQADVLGAARRRHGAGRAGVPGKPNVALVRQLGLLLSRYWKVKIRDRAGAAIMFLQAPIIGVMLGVRLRRAEGCGALLVPRRAPAKWRRATPRRPTPRAS